MCWTSTVETFGCQLGLRYGGLCTQSSIQTNPACNWLTARLALTPVSFVHSQTWAKVMRKRRLIDLSS